MVTATSYRLLDCSEHERELWIVCGECGHGQHFNAPRFRNACGQPNWLRIVQAWHCDCEAEVN